MNYPKSSYRQHAENSNKMRKTILTLFISNSIIMEKVKSTAYQKSRESTWKIKPNAIESSKMCKNATIIY